jgi:uroporphyrinogen III methyltransferase/synthase
LAWVENKPLWGKRVVVTRARAQASALADKLKELGASVIEFPTIEVTPEEDLSPLHHAFRSIDSFNWIIFTSVNAVDIFFTEMMADGLDIRCLTGINICAIGPATCERLRNRGIKSDIVPSEYVAEGLIEELEKKIKPGQSVLLPRARGARAILPEAINEMGAHVSEVNLYSAAPAANVCAEDLGQILAGKVDLITFTSSSTVTNFVNIIGAGNVEKLAEAKIACIGPITADTAKNKGFKVDLIAPEYTIAGLIEVILEQYK